MGTHQAILVHDPLTELGAALASAGHRAVEDEPGWMRVTSADESSVAEALSLALSATVVWWSIHTVVDQLWLCAFARGVAVRELRYSGDEGWAANKGAPLPFENGTDLGKWLERRTLRASPQGYDVIACFLGRSAPPPAPDVKDPGASVVLMLPPSLVEEVRAVAARRAVDFSSVVGEAWSLGRERLRESLSQPEHALPPAAFEDVRELDLQGAAVKCALALPGEVLAELQELVESSDRSRSWLVLRAYLLARADVLHG